MALRASFATAFLFALLLPGCTAVGLARLEPGRSTETDVRQVLGEPARAYANPDGSRQLVFPRGPEGLQTYMAFVAADGRLVRLEQALTEQQLARISPGETTADEVERLVGPPWRRIDFPNKRATAWDYVIGDDWGYTVDFAVMVGRDGIVTEKVHARRSRGDAGFSSK
jgi:hypothetical protein